MKGLRLYKKERLCSKKVIDALFLPSGAGHRRSAVAYPWRAVWRVDESRAGECARFVVSVPKRRLRHAVDRVAMRRKCREVYRLNRHLLPEGSGVDVAFVYVSDSVGDYNHTQRSVTRLLSKVAEGLPVVK